MSLPIYTQNDRRFQNLDGIVREALNEHADAIDSIEDGALNQLLTVYVSKAGDNTNGGFNTNDPKLTIGSAVSAALNMAPTQANQISVQILDSGTYAESFTLPEWVHLFGPNAATDGEIDLDDNCIIRLRRLGNTGTGSCISKINGSGLSKVTADIMLVSSVNNEGIFLKNGQLGANISTIICDAGTSFIVRAGSRLVFDIQYMTLLNSGRGFLTSTTGGIGNVINGNLLLVDDDATGRFIRTVVDGDTVDIQGGQFLVNNLYDVGLNSITNLFAHKTTGSRTSVASAQVNIMDTSGDSNLQGDLHIEGTLTADKIGSITQINVASDLGAPVAGYYQLPAGYYVFKEAIDWGTDGLEFIDSDSVYRLDSPLLKMQTYTGTNPFIKATGADNIIFLDYMSFNTPNATAIELTTGGSLLSEVCLFLGCKQVHNLVDLGFLTIGAIAMVACEEGIVADNVGISVVTRLQWSSGADVGGVAYTALGASSQRLIFLGNETEAAASESIFDIQATFGGIMSNTGGAHSFGDYFKTGSRDQTDVSIESYHCIGTADSRFIGSSNVQDNTTATTITSVDVFVPFNLNSLAAAGENIERWSMTDSNTAELTCDVNGFAGTLSATLSTTGSGSSSEYHFRVVKNGVQVNGVIANELSNNMGNTFLSIPITADQGDTFVLQVANHDNTSDITLRYGDINIS